MDLPNYFLADLPRDATLTPAMLTEACQTLKRNRAQFLLHRSTDEIIRVIDEVARRWRDPAYALRRLALERGPDELSFSRATLERGLNDFFGELRGERLEALIVSDLGHRHRLDHFVAASAEAQFDRSSVARGPELLFHIGAGHIPNPALMSLVLGLLVRSAQFLKCAAGTSLLPCLLAHSIYENDRKLGACLEVAEWRGGDEALEAAVFAEADCVTVTGSDETLASVRNRLPTRTRFLGYGHRVSFGYVTREALAGFGWQRWVAKAADDVVAWDQLGCLSPHAFFVESGGRISPEQFAEALASELEKREQTEPRGPVSLQAAARIASQRSLYELRAAHSQDVQLWRSENSTAWTVVFESEAAFHPSCLHRFIHVRSVASLEKALRAAETVRNQVSTVGLAAAETEIQNLALTLARSGVTRVCPIGHMQRPPLAWRHDGRPALADLVTWTDVENG